MEWFLYPCARKKSSYMKALSATLLLCLTLPAAAQDTAGTDTGRIHTLQPVIINAYGANRLLAETPAAIDVIAARDLQQYNINSFLPALNAAPGVRMEERSPGSYRLSIRGSSLRSPFGVRNVKIYYNDIPITDPGGFTYLNMLGFYNAGSIQVIKGPGSSLYGAGNGGVVLVSSPHADSSGIAVGFSGGSYGQRSATLRSDLAGRVAHHQLGYEYQAADGYRAHSRADKHVLSYDAAVRLGTRTSLDAHVLYNHLYYETPGALTLAEYKVDPRYARPGTATIPGAVTQQAAIDQDNLLAGLSVRHRYTPHLQHVTTVYGIYSMFSNPAIRNYSRTMDPHFGLRTALYDDRTLGSVNLHITGGAEWQQSLAVVQTYENIKGNAGALQSDRFIRTSNILGFLQTSIGYRRWLLEAGIGLSRYTTGIQVKVPQSQQGYQVKLWPVAPRIALLYKAHTAASCYVNIARGFSVPATEELAPSGSALNIDLQPEYGWNYEAGIRGAVLHNRLSYDVSVFYYRLTHAIVVRKDSLGGDYYINAGNTRQQGLEAWFSYELLREKRWLRTAVISAGAAIYHFRYGSFYEDDKDYSGKELPGVPPQTFTARLNMYFPHSAALLLNYYYTSGLALNDANTADAAPCHLLDAKLMCAFPVKQVRPEIFAGVSNLLDQRYSLGYDINAAGGRYYNAAPRRSIYLGIMARFPYRRGE